MVQTRSASGIDLPATPAPARPASSSSSGRDATRKVSASTRSRRSTPAVEDSDSKPAAAAAAAPVTRRKKASSSSTKSTSPTSSPTWTYTPDTATLLWLAVSLPLVAWDTGYVLLRPHTMPGGALHWPLYTPYALYGEVDHVYGFKQWNARNGFTAAQGALNFVETAMYLVYLGVWQAYGTSGTSGTSVAGSRKALVGRPAAWATLLALSAAVMTLSKTVLYWLNEYFSDFDNIGHNDLYSLIVLWILPNGMWLVFPTYVIYKIGGELIDVLASTSGAAIKEE